MAAVAEGRVLGPANGKRVTLPIPGSTVVFKAWGERAPGDRDLAEFILGPGFPGPRPHVHYAGYRQDIGQGPGVRMCEVIAGTGNIIAALPSGLVGPWLNAADALTRARGLAEPSGTQPEVPGGGNGVRVGLPVDDRPGFAWMFWHA